MVSEALEWLRAPIPERVAGCSPPRDPPLPRGLCDLLGRDSVFLKLPTEGREEKSPRKRGKATMRRFDKPFGFAVVLAVAVAVSACEGGGGDVVSTSEVPTLTFRADVDGKVSVTPSDDFRAGTFPYRMLVLDVNGKVLKDEVKTAPSVLDPPTPEQEKEMRAALNSEAGRRFLELESGS